MKNMILELFQPRKDIELERQKAQVDG